MKAFRTKFEAAKENLRKEFEAETSVIFQGIFDAHPNLTAFRWGQTPANSNDGDPTPFGITALEYTFEDPTEEAYFEVEYETEAPEELKELETILNLAPDILEMMFDSSVRVTVTRDGIDVSEYEWY